MNDLVDKIAKGQVEEPKAVETVATLVMPAETEAKTEPVIAATEPVKAPMTYKEMVDKNLENGHNRVKLAQELIEKYGDTLSLEVIGSIVERVEEDAKIKITKPGYDPSKYTDIIYTDAQFIADNIVATKKARELQKQNDIDLDHYNAVAEFGAKNVHKKDEALKWYSEKMGLPLSLLNVDSPEKKAAIYEAYNKGADKTAAQSTNEFFQGLYNYMTGKK